MIRHWVPALDGNLDKLIWGISLVVCLESGYLLSDKLGLKFGRKCIDLSIYVYFCVRNIWKRGEVLKLLLILDQGYLLDQKSWSHRPFSHGFGDFSVLLDTSSLTGFRFQVVRFLTTNKQFLFYLRSWVELLPDFIREWWLRTTIHNLFSSHFSQTPRI